MRATYHANRITFDSSNNILRWVGLQIIKLNSELNSEVVNFTRDFSDGKN